MKNLRQSKRAAPPVPYGHCRPHFKSGDLIAQSHGDFKSFNGMLVIGVRVFTLSTYSHVGVIEVDQTDGRVYVYEAVRPQSHRVLLSSIGSFYHFPLPQARWNDIAKTFAQRAMGTLYSRWVAIKAYFGPLPAGTVCQCAALAREILLRCGVDLGPISRPDKVVQAALDMGSQMTFVVNGGDK